MAMFFLTPGGELTGEHTKDTLKTVQENLKAEKAILLDVREKEEWKQGHLKDARLVPLSEIKANAEAASKKLPKKLIIYTHCKAGQRSMYAAEFLKKYELDVRALRAGYEELLEAGFSKDESQPDQ